MHFGDPSNDDWKFDGYFFPGNALKFGSINSKFKNLKKMCGIFQN